MTESVAAHVRERVYKRSTTCFFTGIELEKSNRSVEHLIPQDALKKKGYLDAEWNTVPAHREVNGVVGNSPLAVKFALREFLLELIIFPGMTDDKVIETYKFAANQFLYTTYAIDGVLPWKWKTHNFKKSLSKTQVKERRRELREAYMSLVTQEEIALNGYIS